MRSGYTLLELLLVLALMAVGFIALAPGMRRQQERLMVRSARESLVGLISRARAHAVIHGGATVTLKASPATATLTSGGQVRDSIHLAASRVELTLSGDRPEARLHFNAMGLGELAGQTVRLTVGSAHAGLIVSAYGWIRRW